MHKNAKAVRKSGKRLHKYLNIYTDCVRGCILVDFLVCKADIIYNK